MARQWTFGEKVGTGFAVAIALAVTIGAVAIYALNSVVDAKDRVITLRGRVVQDVERLRVWIEKTASANRGFLLSGEDTFLAELREARAKVAEIIDALATTLPSEEGRRMLAAIAQAESDHRQAVDDVIAQRKAGATVEVVAGLFDAKNRPLRAKLEDTLRPFLEFERRLATADSAAASATASLAITLVIAIGAAAILLGALMAFVLARTLSRQIATAVSQVQSSATELQAAANQQAVGAKEQSTAMTEISTTITELLATSRQIAESARRVVQVADQTAGSARSGESTVSSANEAIAAIRRQVDLIVNHMLDLGKKSQQIGAVLDIVSELAEQTNILAINATIEAAGAGETGKRFGVVADEIRKLADRVSGSTKEIRTLIDDVRTAVNTTVMATEAGSKSVDAGSRQFVEVTSSFKQIGGLVVTTTDAAREIELSTKQQSTAVEQVNVAISNIAQATKETEASSGQTLQTASQLAGLSKDLLRLVQTANHGR
jgi:methyl-accepting chemotaxis protein